MPKGLMAIVALSLIACLGSLRAHAAADVFLAFAEPTPKDPSVEIKGESTDTQFKGTMQFESLGFEIENKPLLSSSSGGAGASKVRFKEVSVLAKVDSSTPALYQACALGARYKTVTISFRKAGSSTTYLVVELGDVSITSAEQASSGEVPELKFTLAFASLTLKYTGQDPKTGSPTTTDTVSWDQTTNSPK